MNARGKSWSKQLGESREESVLRRSEPESVGQEDVSVWFIVVGSFDSRSVSVRDGVCRVRK